MFSDEGLETMPTFASAAKMAIPMRRAASPFITCETKRLSVIDASTAIKCFHDDQQPDAVAIADREGCH
jgi:hypothetical protein